MKRYAKFGYAAPFRFRVILEKPQGGQNDPPTRAKVNSKPRCSQWHGRIQGRQRGHGLSQRLWNHDLAPYKRCKVLTLCLWPCMERIDFFGQFSRFPKHHLASSKRHFTSSYILLDPPLLNGDWWISGMFWRGPYDVWMGPNSVLWGAHLPKEV